jgi:hypothetical protein
MIGAGMATLKVGRPNLIVSQETITSSMTKSAKVVAAEN